MSIHLKSTPNMILELTLQAQAQAAQLEVDPLEDDEEARLALEYSQLKAQYDSKQ